MWGRDDYDDYDDRYRDRQRYDNERDTDDLIEMLVRFVLIVGAIGATIYGGAYLIDHYLPFGTHWATGFNDWVKGLFDGIGSKSGTEPTSTPAPAPPPHQ